MKKMKDARNMNGEMLTWVSLENYFTLLKYLWKNQQAISKFDFLKTEWVQTVRMTYCIL